MNWREELAWAAGFYDGEGNAGWLTQTHKYGKNRYPQLTIGQWEITTLTRFRKAVLGKGKIYGPYKQSNGRKDSYCFKVYTRNDVQFIAALLWKFLSDPKKEQLERVLRESRGA